MPEHLVQPEEAGRSARDIARRVMGVSYTAFQSAKWDGRVLRNGTPCRADEGLRPGDVLTVLLREKPPVFLPRPCERPLAVRYQDSCLMIVDKPAPLPVQCGREQDNDTLENMVFSHFGCPPDFVYRPVNRLDKGTSGLMAIALDAHSQQLMQRQLHTPAFRRIYLAVTRGLPPQAEGVIDLPIAKADGATVRRVIRPDGKPSVTRYRVIARQGERALLRLELETGRTHQIRVHLSALGCPVFGDFLYGEEAPELPGRFALHSAELQLTHPLTGEALSFRSPLPGPLQALLAGGSPVAS